MKSKLVGVLYNGTVYAKACDGYWIKAGDRVYICPREYGGCGGVYNIKNNTMYCRNCAKSRGNIDVKDEE